jgi:thiol-disulfide isomerase/thioredoxin
VSVAARVAAAAVAIALAAGASADAPPRLRAWIEGATPALAGVELSSGRGVDLRELRGRVVLVQFWASWCEPCAAELPALARLVERQAGRPFVVVTVNHGESPERIRAFLDEHGVERLPVVADRDQTLARSWGVGGLPMAFLVDAGGQVRSSVFGALDWTAGEAGAALEGLIAEAERAAPRRARVEPR